MSAFLVKSLNELIEDGLIQLMRGKIISKKDIAACPGGYPIYSSAKDNNGKFGEYGKYLFDEELITWSVDGGAGSFTGQSIGFLSRTLAECFVSVTPR